MAEVVGVIEETALVYVQIPDCLNCRIQTHHGQSEGAVVVLNGGIFLRHADDVTSKRDVVAQQVDIFVRETDLDPGLVAASLLRGASGKDADGSGAETFEDVLNGAAEAVAVGQKQNDGRNAPCHSRHGEKSTPEIVAHSGDGLLEQVAMHENPDCPGTPTPCAEPRPAEVRRRDWRGKAPQLLRRWPARLRPTPPWRGQV